MAVACPVKELVLEAAEGGTRVSAFPPTLQADSAKQPAKTIANSIDSLCLTINYCLKSIIIASIVSKGVTFAARRRLAARIASRRCTVRSGEEPCAN